MRRLILVSALLLSLPAAAAQQKGKSGPLKFAQAVKERVKQLRSRETKITLDLGDNTLVAFHHAAASGKPTAIKMDFGTLHLHGGEALHFDIATGSQVSLANGVRRAHNLASEIGPVMVVHRGEKIGYVTGKSAAENAVLKKLKLQ